MVVQSCVYNRGAWEREKTASILEQLMLISLIGKNVLYGDGCKLNVITQNQTESVNWKAISSKFLSLSYLLQ